MKVIATNQAPAAIGPYSQGYVVNGLLFTRPSSAAGISARS